MYRRIESSDSSCLTIPLPRLAGTTKVKDRHVLPQAIDRHQARLLVPTITRLPLLDGQIWDGYEWAKAARIYVGPGQTAFDAEVTAI
jgi:hypothetical protein